MFNSSMIPQLSAQMPTQVSGKAQEAASLEGIPVELLEQLQAQSPELLENQNFLETLQLQLKNQKNTSLENRSSKTQSPIVDQMQKQLGQIKKQEILNELDKKLLDGTQDKTAEITKPKMGLTSNEELIQRVLQQGSAATDTAVSKPELSKMSVQQKPAMHLVQKSLGNVELSNEGEETALPANIVNAEERSRQFVPERKSIFEIKNQAKDQLLDNDLMIQGRLNGQKHIAREMALNTYGAERPQSLFAKSVAENASADQKLKSKIIGDRMPSSAQDLLMKNEMGQFDRMANHIEASANNTKGMSLQTNATKSAFDLAKLDTMAQVDSISIMDKVQDYIIQARAAKTDNIDMSFNDVELGNVGLRVQKLANNSLNITIGVNNAQSAQFFNQHQTELLSTLGRAGIMVNDFKLESGSSSFSGSNNNSNGHFQSNDNHASEFAQNHQRQQDSKRREQLWNMMYERSAA